MACARVHGWAYSPFPTGYRTITTTEGLISGVALEYNIIMLIIMISIC